MNSIYRVVGLFPARTSASEIEARPLHGKTLHGLFCSVAFGAHTVKIDSSLHIHMPKFVLVLLWVLHHMR